MLHGVVTVFGKCYGTLQVDGFEGMGYDGLTIKRAKEEYIQYFGINEKIKWEIVKWKEV